MDAAQGLQPGRGVHGGQRRAAAAGRPPRDVARPRRRRGAGRKRRVRHSLLRRPRTAPPSSQRGSSGCSPTTGRRRRSAGRPLAEFVGGLVMIALIVRRCSASSLTPRLEEEARAQATAASSARWTGHAATDMSVGRQVARDSGSLATGLVRHVGRQLPSCDWADALEGHRARLPDRGRVRRAASWSRSGSALFLVDASGSVRRSSGDALVGPLVAGASASSARSGTFRSPPCSGTAGISFGGVIVVHLRRPDRRCRSSTSTAKYYGAARSPRFLARHPATRSMVAGRARSCTVLFERTRPGADTTGPRSSRSPSARVALELHDVPEHHLPRSPRR